MLTVACVGAADHAVSSTAVAAPPPGSCSSAATVAVDVPTAVARTSRQDGPFVGPVELDNAISKIRARDAAAVLNCHIGEFAVLIPALFAVTSNRATSADLHR
jgi:hypothetical protein